MARSVIWRQAGSMPQMNRAGIVNNTPEATEELAEPMVCDMFASRIEWRSPKALNTRTATTVNTTTGREVQLGRPTLTPW